ncbi:hypothetical protein LY76DRAFT_597250 [Colletotrichum caudatum]|nr:hypothetical protein LY76DRAFT_597250 [Colletotrichum caudatum]
MRTHIKSPALIGNLFAASLSAAPVVSQDTTAFKAQDIVARDANPTRSNWTSRIDSRDLFTDFAEHEDEADVGAETVVDCRYSIRSAWTT